MGKSGLQLKATSVVTKAVSKANEVASKRNAGNAVESGEAKAARVGEQGENDKEISAEEPVTKDQESSDELPPMVTTSPQESKTSDEEIAVDAMKTASKDSESVRRKRETAEVRSGEQEDEELSLTGSEGS